MFLDRNVKSNLFLQTYQNGTNVTSVATLPASGLSRIKTIHGKCPNSIKVKRMRYDSVRNQNTENEEKRVSENQKRQKQ
jgi:hypothetical protein